MRNLVESKRRLKKNKKLWRRKKTDIDSFSFYGFLGLIMLKQVNWPHWINVNLGKTLIYSKKIRSVQFSALANFFPGFGYTHKTIYADTTYTIIYYYILFMML